VGFDVLTTCQSSTVWCSRERLPAAAAQPAKARQSLFQGFIIQSADFKIEPRAHVNNILMSETEARERDGKDI
jgi:hypothetical protein